MNSVLTASLQFLGASFCLFAGVGLLFASYCFLMEFLKYRKYYKTIMNHPEVFGNSLDIPIETKRKIVEKMDVQVQKSVKPLLPENQGIGLKIFTPDDEKLTG